MKEYWEGRYSKETKIWGDNPSLSAAMALERFNERKCRSLLVPGAGYGRNAVVFSGAGMDVTGVEISESACALARSFAPDVRMVHSSVTGFDPGPGLYDAIYSYSLLHLFLREDRCSIVSLWHKALKEGGCVFCTVFSELDPACGRGPEVEPGTFESKPGRPVHYFTGKDLAAHFSGFHVLETGIVEDSENHGEEGPHVHVLRYIYALKK